jgi:hypothetical protein
VTLYLKKSKKTEDWDEVYKDIKEEHASVTLFDNRV